MESKFTLHSDCGKGLMQKQCMSHLVPACFSEERLPRHACGCCSNLQACSTSLSRGAPAQQSLPAPSAKSRLRMARPDQSIRPRSASAPVRSRNLDAAHLFGGAAGNRLELVFAQALGGVQRLQQAADVLAQCL